MIIQQIISCYSSGHRLLSNFPGLFLREKSQILRLAVPLQLLCDFLEKLSEDDHPTPPPPDVDDSQTSSHDANDTHSNLSQDFNDSQSDSTQESRDLEPNSSQNTDNS